MLRAASDQQCGLGNVGSRDIIKNNNDDKCLQAGFASKWWNVFKYEALGCDSSGVEKVEDEK